ncbi:hypothetical protein GCM10007868_11340 [Gluconobacter frateurii]|uniref:Uncharacterized protein n=1 Tax=Gluconobacter frateurii NRIC 0228 TaxID=1307946 RepID=A0ABQ0QDG2_9PROT|nr:hypothetical protein AA0228_2266 [Gluconobacter frateurii NRIC 0228]GLP90059.1 hypothetical protein GCM10007868_11340 [Gluconobacter frateurii]
MTFYAKVSGAASNSKESTLDFEKFKKVRLQLIAEELVAIVTLVCECQMNVPKCARDCMRLFHEFGPIRPGTSTEPTGAPLNLCVADLRAPISTSYTAIIFAQKPTKQLLMFGDILLLHRTIRPPDQHLEDANLRRCPLPRRNNNKSFIVGEPPN